MEQEAPWAHPDPLVEEEVVDGAQGGVRLPAVNNHSNKIWIVQLGKYQKNNNAFFVAIEIQVVYEDEENKLASKLNLNLNFTIPDKPGVLKEIRTSRSIDVQVIFLNSDFKEVWL